MAGQLITQVDRRLLLVAALTAVAGSALMALVSSLMVLQLTSRQAVATSELFEADLLRDLRTVDRLSDLQSTLQLAVSPGGIQEALLLDDRGTVIAATTPALVGQPIEKLARLPSAGPLVRRLALCARPGPDNPCRRPETSHFIGSRPLVGARELLRTRRTALPIRPYDGPGEEVVLATSVDLQPLLNRSQLLAAELFLAGVLPLLATSAGLVLVVRRSVLPELFHLAQTDSLSGVYNRRAFLDVALSLLANAQLLGQPTVLAILDVDAFKTINDTHGHGVGDEVIRHLSDLLLGMVRRTDLVGRLGGDEFVLLLETTRPAGRQLLERIRLAVAHAPCRLSDGRDVPLALSIGMACSDGRAGYRLNALLEEADAALYVAKQQGRNRVIDLEG